MELSWIYTFGLGIFSGTGHASWITRQRLFFLCLSFSPLFDTQIILYIISDTQIDASYLLSCTKIRNWLIFKSRMPLKRKTGTFLSASFLQVHRYLSMLKIVFWAWFLRLPAFIFAKRFILIIRLSFDPILFPCPPAGFMHLAFPILALMKPRPNIIPFCIRFLYSVVKESIPHLLVFSILHHT